MCFNFALLRWLDPAQVAPKPHKTYLVWFVGGTFAAAVYYEFDQTWRTAQGGDPLDNVTHYAEIKAPN
jgi:hypothetical protein